MATERAAILDRLVRSRVLVPWQRERGSVSAVLHGRKPQRVARVEVDENLYGLFFVLDVTGEWRKVAECNDADEAMNRAETYTMHWIDPPRFLNTRRVHRDDNHLATGWDLLDRDNNRVGFLRRVSDRVWKSHVVRPDGTIPQPEEAYGSGKLWGSRDQAIDEVCRILVRHAGRLGVSR